MPEGTTASVGRRSGTLTIDNLDVTTGAGAGPGRGALDGDDVVHVSATVVSTSNASFASGADAEFLTLDFGTIGLGLWPVTGGFDTTSAITRSPPASTNSDGTVSLADFLILRANFGTSDPAAAAVMDPWLATVPEPTSLAALGLGGLVLGRASPSPPSAVRG